MSQKKVDSRKQKKTNRDKLAKKEQMELLLEKILWAALGVLFVWWVGYSLYAKVTSGATEVKTETVMDTSALDTYMSEVSAEDSEEETEAEDASSEETSEETSSEESTSEETSSEESTAEETTSEETTEEEEASAEDAE